MVSPTYLKFNEISNFPDFAVFITRFNYNCFTSKGRRQKLSKSL
jgi:hypothetical protein